MECTTEPSLAGHENSLFQPRRRSGLPHYDTWSGDVQAVTAKESYVATTKVFTNKHQENRALMRRHLSGRAAGGTHCPTRGNAFWRDTLRRLLNAGELRQPP